MNKKIKIGVVGYSGKSFPIFEASQKIIDALDEVIQSFRYYDRWNCPRYPSFEVVSGYTDYGIPALSYAILNYIVTYREVKCTTTGFAPKEALSRKRCKVDKEIIVGENFGDESEAFVDYIDVLIKIGGGEQSIKEFALFNKKKPNNIAIEKKLIHY